MRRLGSSMAAGLVLLSGLTACSDGGSSAAPTPSATPRTSPTPCAVPSSKPVVWPKEVPADLPQPPGITVEKTEFSRGGIFTMRFATPQSLNDGVLFVVRSLPKKGFVIGRGDAEAFEADAPFARGQLRGLFRMLASAPCKTLWLLAIGNANGFRNGAPFAPNYSPSANATPLPFG